MNEIRDLTSAICLNLASDPHLLQGTIRQSIKELCSFSRQMKSLGDYGPMPISKKLFEPVSPGGSSPCHSDNCLEDDEEKTRVREPSLYEVAEIFLDTSAVIEITQSAKSSNWCLWIMICGLNEESSIKGLMTLIDKHLQNIHYETCKKIVYKGQISFALHFKEHFTTQKVFTFLSEDFYAKTYIKDRWKVLRFYNRMDDPKYMLEFFGVILQNLPLESTSQTIIDLVAMNSSNMSVLSVEIPTLIGESLCSFIRTKTLEDAETLALTLNGLITQTGNIRVGLHPKCNFRHKSFEKDPFKEIKLQTSPKNRAKSESLEEKKNDIKSLLSLFKSELKTPEPKSQLGNVDLMSPEQEVQLFDTFSPSNSKIHNNPPSNLHPYGHHENEGQRVIHHQPFPQFPPLTFQRPHPGGAGFMIPNQNLNYLRHPYNMPPQAQFKQPPFYGPHHQHLGPDFHNSIRPHFPHHKPEPFQKFGKKIQKMNLKPTRTSNNNPVKSNVKKMQPTKTVNKRQELEIPQKEDLLASPLAVVQEKKVEADKGSNRSLIGNVQNKKNLEKIFEKKLADWNIGVFQIKSTHEKKSQDLPPKNQSQNEKRFENRQAHLGKDFSKKTIHKEEIPKNQWSIGVNNTVESKNSSGATKWKITCGTNLTVQTEKVISAKLPSYLENMMDQMIATPLKNSRENFGQGESINQKRKLGSLYSNSDIPELQKIPDESAEHQNFRSTPDEEKEMNAQPHKKMCLETSTNTNDLSKKLSLGWSIQCQPTKGQKKAVEFKQKIQNNPSISAQSQVPPIHEKIPQMEAEKKDNQDNKQPNPVPTVAGPTNIVFNGPYVQSSNLNYMYLHPNVAYPNMLMNMNHPHHPPVQNPFLSFNPQMMVYHNNFILNPLAPPHHQSFWNVPSNPEKFKSPSKNFSKKFTDFSKAKGDEECPEPESTPPVFPKEPPQENQIDHCD